MMIDIGIVGATGLVGREMQTLLAERAVPVRSLRLLASCRSAGRTMTWGATSVTVEEASTADPGGLDVVLFSAGAELARQLAPRFVEAGAVVIDNSSAFREDPQVPLVVPEVNAAALTAHRGLIANPNCSTIQLVVALKPLHDAAGLRRVVVSTYQSVSGQGQKGLDALAPGGDPERRIFPHPVDGEALPHCGAFDVDGWTSEERKLMHETRRILGLPGLAISATAVRVPVVRSHSEAVWVETCRVLDVPAARAALRAAPGVSLIDVPQESVYPLARRAAGTDPVYVGRLRRDPSVETGLVFWVVADNVRKGAALNAVQILEELVARRLCASRLRPQRS
ncbi:MAG: aspartate-semialdehyde dehydrogenase [Candidatus Eiseniibacteriota bacterium]|jgi:aspartate-semialdehyde dehydrogenase